MSTDWNCRMREDWDARARQDAEHFIYTRDDSSDVNDFALSGEANYNQLVRPYLPLLLNGRNAADCSVVEIGCGLGRMTEYFARDFSRIEAVDVAPIMIAGARKRLSHLSNVAFHLGTGSELSAVNDASIDLVFSYIVFQHIPSAAVIEQYVAEAVRVLRRGGALKFQLNGDQSAAYRQHQRDTWQGETFSATEAAEMLTRHGFNMIAMEGAGTQYFVITARKGPVVHEGYVLPGETWAEPLLLEGFGPPVDSSWRPIASRARVIVPGTGSHGYLGLYFWPGSCRHTLAVAGQSFRIENPGDHVIEFDSPDGEIEISIDPPPAKLPAFRIIGKIL